MKSSKLIIIFLFTILFQHVSAQIDYEPTYMITPELRLNIQEPALEFRYRQLDYYAPISTNGVYRTELMSGIVLFGGTFKIYNHTRLDNGGTANRRLRASTGIRFDINTLGEIAGRPVSINNQLRRFWPLNGNTTHQYVFVQDWSWMYNDRIWPSLLGFSTATKATSEDSWGYPKWWFGPGVVIHWIPGKLNTYTCFLPELYSLGSETFTPFVFLRLQYKLKW